MYYAHKDVLITEKAQNCDRTFTNTNLAPLKKWWMNVNDGQDKYWALQTVIKPESSSKSTVLNYYLSSVTFNTEGDH